GTAPRPLSRPLATAVAGEQEALAAPIAFMLRQLAVMLILPIAAGMAFRRAKPGCVNRHERGLRVTGLAAVAALVAIIIAQQTGSFTRTLGEAAGVVTLLTLLALGVGVLVGRICRLAAAEQFVVATRFPGRNIAVAAFIAVTLLGRVEFAAFGAAYFLIQLPLLLGAVALYRFVRSGCHSAGRTDEPRPNPEPAASN